MTTASQWLKSCQKEDGTWSLKQYPAITALAARAILQDPSQPAGRMDPAAEKGLAYVASCARPDGGIFCEVPANKGGTQANYNTAASLLGIYAAHETRYEPLVRAARSYLIRTQHLEKDDFYGGWGYDASRKDPHADMSNTGFTMQALYVTAPREGVIVGLQVVSNSPKPASRSRSPPRPPRRAAQTETPPPEAVPDDPNWAAATAFLSHCQNLASDAEKQRAVSKRPQDIGGFYYHPNGSMAGGELDEDGRQIWHSYGNATALGLECLLEAHVDRKDPRVAATVNWLRSNYNLEEHPGGMGKSGIVFLLPHPRPGALDVRRRAAEARGPAGGGLAARADREDRRAPAHRPADRPEVLGQRRRALDGERPGARHRLQRAGARDAREGRRRSRDSGSHSSGVTSVIWS